MTNLNLNFNEGVKTFSINNDPERVIAVNLTDFGILERFETASKKIKTFIDDFDAVDVEGSHSMSDPEVQMFIRSDKFIREQIDYIFNSNVSDIVFGKTNCVSLVKGEPLYLRFFEAILPEIQKALKDERRRQYDKTQKYNAAVKYKKKNKKGGHKK